MLYLHVKTGHTYSVLATGVQEADLNVVVLYQRCINGQFVGPIWVRPAKEFFDGRFVAHVDTPTSPDVTH